LAQFIICSFEEVWSHIGADQERHAFVSYWNGESFPQSGVTLLHELPWALHIIECHMHVFERIITCAGF
jgi:hypothetical protein